MEYERRRQRVSHFDNEPSSRSRSCGAYRPLKFLRTNADTELIPFLLTGRFNKHPSVRLYRVPFQYGLAPVSFFQRASGVRLAPFPFSFSLSLSPLLSVFLFASDLYGVRHVIGRFTVQDGPWKRRDSPEACSLAEQLRRLKWSPWTGWWTSDRSQDFSAALREIDDAPVGCFRFAFAATLDRLMSCVSIRSSCNRGYKIRSGRFLKKYEAHEGNVARVFRVLS